MKPSTTNIRTPFNKDSIFTTGNSGYYTVGDGSSIGISNMNFGATSTNTATYMSAADLASN